MSKTIDKMMYFAVGQCCNRLDRLFRGKPKQEIIFPAGVFLMHHRQRGYILYDTGYGEAIMSSKLKYRVYRALNPIQLTKNQTLVAQLQQKGISPKDIRYIFLSHLHPDHIGGVRDFPHAQFVLTKQHYDFAQRASRKALVFQELLPDHFYESVHVLEPNERLVDFPYVDVVDWFGDGSIYVAQMGGHSVAQGCLFLPEYQLFLAADTLWRTEFMQDVDRMKLLPKLIQHNMPAYRQSVQCLKQMLSDGYKIVVSHDPQEVVEAVLNE